VARLIQKKKTKSQIKEKEPRRENRRLEEEKEKN